MYCAVTYAVLCRAVLQESRAAIEDVAVMSKSQLSRRNKVGIGARLTEAHYSHLMRYSHASFVPGASLSRASEGCVLCAYGVRQSTMCGVPVMQHSPG